MKLIAIEIPDTLNLTDSEAKMIFAAKLYEMGKVSQGHGASIAGVSKRAFIESLGNYGVSFFNYSPEELEKEFEVSDKKYTPAFLVTEAQKKPK